MIATLEADFTTEQLLELPDDGIDRWIAYGELREAPMSRRSPAHSLTVANLACQLVLWQRSLPAPRGQIHVGDATLQLVASPRVTVGTDLAYVHAEMIATRSPQQRYFNGPPVLAVEVLSPTDQQEDIYDKLALYLDNGTGQVWHVEPNFRTITVYRPGQPAQLYNASDTIPGGPDLPGLQLLVDDAFAT